MGRFQQLRAWLLPGLPLHLFLFWYVATEIIGNAFYTTPFGRNLPAFNITNFSWDVFSTPLRFEFWLLLLLPVLMIPIALVTRRLTAPLATRVEQAIPEIPFKVFLAVTAALYCFVIIRMADAHALDRLVTAKDAVAAVENRFSLLSDLGTRPQIVLKSLLVFLTVYGLIRAVRGAGSVWYVATALNITLLTVLLLLLNMKWPVLIFIFTLAVCVFCFCDRRPYLKAAALTALAALLYFAVSAYLLRILPMPGQPEQQTQMHTNTTPRLIEGRRGDVPQLVVLAMNRMAIAAPYYFDFPNFSGANCAPSLSRLWIKRDIACEPTLLVYTKMFGDDGFKGRGTAPASINLYGYALDGWTGAVISTALAAIVIGFFLAIWRPAQRNAIFAAAFTMGSYTAYFFSQLPVEGPIEYDHGMLWWALLVLAWSVGYWLVKWILGKQLGRLADMSSENL